jgi:anti-sigma B factor antagonist
MTAASLDEPDTGSPPDGRTRRLGALDALHDPLDDALLTVLVSRTPHGLCLTARGEVDSASAPGLRERLEAVVTSGAAEVVVDLTAVSFLDSAGLCALAVGHKLAQGHGTRLRVLAAGRAVVRPMQVTGLWDLLGAERVDGTTPA